MKFQDLICETIKIGLIIQDINNLILLYSRQFAKKNENFDQFNLFNIESMFIILPTETMKQQKLEKFHIHTELDKEESANSCN